MRLLILIILLPFLGNSQPSISILYDDIPQMEATVNRQLARTTLVGENLPLTLDSIQHFKQVGVFWPFGSSGPTRPVDYFVFRFADEFQGKNWYDQAYAYRQDPDGVWRIKSPEQFNKLPRKMFREAEYDLYLLHGQAQNRSLENLWTFSDVPIERVKWYINQSIKYEDVVFLDSTLTFRMIVPEDLQALFERISNNRGINYER